MIRHVVLLTLSTGYDPAALARIMQGLDGLRAKIAGFSAFAHGPNRDLEGLSPDCAYAFSCDFADLQTHAIYLGDPDHRALGKGLVALCKGGVAGITVVDMEVAA